MMFGCLDIVMLADCMIWLNWLPNLCLAGNAVTRIPDFVQPCVPVCVYNALCVDARKYRGLFCVLMLGNKGDCLFVLLAWVH